MSTPDSGRPQWISVESQLPHTEEMHVLATTKAKVYRAFCRKGVWYNWHTGQKIPYPVLYWADQ